MNQIQLFTQAYLNNEYPLDELLNSSFTADMFQELVNSTPYHLWKKLKTCEGIDDLLSILSKPTISSYTKQLATNIALHIYDKETFKCDNNHSLHVALCNQIWDTLFTPYNKININLDKIERINGEMEVDGPTGTSLALVLHHMVVKCEMGQCLLSYICDHPHCCDFLLSNCGHDDMHTALLRLVYCDHSNEILQTLFSSRIIDKLLKKVIPFHKPLNLFDVYTQENNGLLLREILQAPYLSSRGDAIYAHQPPIEKNSGMTEFPSLSGFAGYQATLPVRKFSSRKIQHLIYLLIESSSSSSSSSLSSSSSSIDQFLVSSFQEIEYWSYPNQYLSFNGRPKASRILVFTQLLMLCETVEFSERNGRGQFGVDCYDHKCPTHHLKRGCLYLKNTFSNRFRTCIVDVNCILGLRLSVNQNEEEISSNSSNSSNSITNDNNNTILKLIPLNEIQSFRLSDWKEYGFCITWKKNHHQREYFACNSQKELDKWMEILHLAYDGNGHELEMLCNENWSHIVNNLNCLRTHLENSCIQHMDRLNFLLQKRSTSTGIHLASIVSFVHAMIRLQSPLIDQALISSDLLSFLLTLYSSYPSNSMLHNLISRIFRFFIEDVNRSRSSDSKIISYLFSSSSSPLIPYLLLLKENNKKSCPINIRPHFQNILHSIGKCFRSPKTSSQEKIQYYLHTISCWTIFHSDFESIQEIQVADLVTKSPEPCDLTQPSFQTDLLEQLSNHEFDILNPAYTVGNGCIYGYMHKQSNHQWLQTLVVLEKRTFKLWYFFPNQHCEGQRISWKWIIPTGVCRRFSQGMDAFNQPIGHHGIEITVNSVQNAPNKLTIFSIPSRAARELWIEALNDIALATNQLTIEFSSHSWFSDSTIQCCQDCFQPFNLYRHRHNCRRCGKCCCAKCCTFRKPIPECGLYKPVRHCSSCYEASGGLRAEMEPLQITDGSPIIHGLKGSVSSTNLAALSI